MATKRLYKFQKGPTSTIRTDEEGCKDAIASGYVYLGECDEAYEIISNAEPIFDKGEGPKGNGKADKKPKDEKTED